MHPIILSVLLASALALTAFLLRQPTRRAPLPPGPKRLPIIGNVLDMPRTYPWLTYMQWAATYGDVVYAEVFGNRLIILNSFKAATELMEGRSSNYSDRPGKYPRFLLSSLEITTSEFNRVPNAGWLDEVGLGTVIYAIFRLVEVRLHFWLSGTRYSNHESDVTEGSSISTSKHAP